MKEQHVLPKSHQSTPFIQAIKKVHMIAPEFREVKFEYMRSIDLRNDCQQDIAMPKESVVWLADSDAYLQMFKLILSETYFGAR